MKAKIEVRDRGTIEMIVFPIILLISLSFSASCSTDESDLSTGGRSDEQPNFAVRPDGTLVMMEDVQGEEIVTTYDPLRKKMHSAIFDPDNGLVKIQYYDQATGKKIVKEVEYEDKGLKIYKVVLYKYNEANERVKEITYGPDGVTKQQEFIFEKDRQRSWKVYAVDGKTVLRELEWEYDENGNSVMMVARDGTGAIQKILPCNPEISDVLLKGEEIEL